VAKTKVTLKLIPSRIDVTVKNEMVGYVQKPSGDKYHKSLQLKDVSIIYSGSRNYLFPTFKNTDTLYVPELATNATGDYYAAGIDPTLALYNLDKTNMVFGNTPNLFADWYKYGTDTEFMKTFYALPNDTVTANHKDVILVVRAEQSIASQPGGLFDSVRSIYFPIAFNTSDRVGQMLGNGQFYTIKITLKGDALTTGGGTTDPTKPVLNAFINVEVKAASWNKIKPIEKIFQ
jgi:hypothetical protein